MFRGHFTAEKRGHFAVEWWGHLRAELVGHYPRILQIEDPIAIGNALITFFNENTVKDYYDNFSANSPGKTIEEFKSMFSFSPHSIKAIVKVNKHESIAEMDAFKEAELAIDVLKCFCFTYSLDSIVAIFDLDYRANKTDTASYIKMIAGDISQSTLHIKRLNGIVPIRITNSFIKNAERLGLNEFSTSCIEIYITSPAGKQKSVGPLLLHRFLQ